MKRTIRIFILIIVSFLLFACTKTETIQTDDGLPLEMVLEQSLETMETVDGYSAEINLEQQLSITGEEPFSTETTLITHQTKDPFRIFQKITSKTSDKEIMNDETINYYTEDGWYIQDPNEKEWIKYPMELVEDTVQMTETQIKPTFQIERIIPYMEFLTVSEDSSHYIISFVGNGEDYPNIEEDMVGMVGTDNQVIMEELLGIMEIDRFHFQIVIDKSNFYLTQTMSEIRLSMGTEDEEMEIVQYVSGMYKNIGEVPAIVVPDNILEDAEEIPVKIIDEFDVEAFGTLEEF